jgi:hypothetical protein
MKVTPQNMAKFAYVTPKLIRPMSKNVLA